MKGIEHFERYYYVAKVASIYCSNLDILKGRWGIAVDQPQYTEENCGDLSPHRPSLDPEYSAETGPKDTCTQKAENTGRAPSWPEFANSIDFQFHE